MFIGVNTVFVIILFILALDVVLVPCTCSCSHSHSLSWFFFVLCSCSCPHSNSCSCYFCTLFLFRTLVFFFWFLFIIVLFIIFWLAICPPRPYVAIYLVFVHPKDVCDVCCQYMLDRAHKSSHGIKERPMFAACMMKLVGSLELHDSCMIFEVTLLMWCSLKCQES